MVERGPSQHVYGEEKTTLLAPVQEKIMQFLRRFLLSGAAIPTNLERGVKDRLSVLCVYHTGVWLLLKKNLCHPPGGGRASYVAIIVLKSFASICRATDNSNIEYCPAYDNHLLLV